MWGSLLSCGRLSIGLRRLPTAGQDAILPHNITLLRNAGAELGESVAELAAKYLLKHIENLLVNRPVVGEEMR